MKIQLCEAIKKNIVNLKNRGYTLTEISDIYEIDRTTVVRILKRYKENGTVERKKGSGRPNKHDVYNIINELLLKDNTLTLKQIVVILKDKYNIEYSFKTIFNKIKKLGFNKEIPILKPLLTEKHLNDREYWAIYYSNYNWAKVIWSDETTVSIQPNKYSKIWIHKDNPITRRTVAHPLKINIWGCIMKDHGLIIHIYDGIMDGAKYVDILQSKLLFLFDIHQTTSNKLIFQQDNAPVHTCKKAIKFFSDNEIEVMFWPANSPDLNPIENVWHLLKTNIGKVHVKTKNELIDIIKTTASKFDIKIINNLIGSMDNRINKLFENNFDSIDY